VFLGGTIIKNCTLCKAERHHIHHFHIVRGLTAILFVGELSVEDIAV
jgi:hypothetical protein